MMGRAPTGSMRRCVFPTMGTVASLLHDGGERVETAVQRLFEHDDALFSLYRDDSELSRVARGEMSLAQTSAPVREAYGTALHWSAATDGWFTPHRADGVLDLNGVVKALSMQRAADALDEAGARNWCLNVGGDVLVGAAASVGRPWRAGIVDPEDRSALLTEVVLAGDLRALATSGTAERGEHLWGRSGAAGASLRQVSVLAPDILTADVCATWLCAAGEGAIDEACRRWPIEVLAADAAGRLTASAGFRARFEGAGREE
ncbi:FAD:protein FMN transferase [Rathayibacter sp. YIM 133350]|uniref:FAD:protein FMN transferase n=1 Tax=Rathayibacter sp. YIM 133350 TaxID=3131992 RepID=UPI00307D983D